MYSYRILGFAVMAICACTAFAQDANPPDPFSLDLASLQNVVVTTASKFPQNLSEAPGVMSVVSHDELRRFGAVTLRQVLERVPSLAGLSASFSERSLITARGDQTKIDGGHVLFLINGRPTREILEGGIVSDLLESFPVGALERIEVIKGPGSVLYGSNAFSAVINLITQKAHGNGVSISGFGGGDGGGASGDLMIQRGNLNIFGSAQIHQLADWDLVYRFPVADSISAQPGTIRNRSEGAYLGLNYKGLSIMSSLTGWENGYVFPNTVGDNHWRRTFADLGYTFKPTSKWDLSLNLTYTRNTFKTSAFPDIRRDSSEVVLEWTNTFRLTNRTNLTAGTLYNYIQGRETYYGVTPPIPISVGDRPGGAVYAQIDQRITDTLKLVGGVQANKIGNIPLKAVPRAGVIWNPIPRVNFKALYSEAFRAPSLNETLLNHPGLAGNPDLKPETVGTVDVGVSFQSNRFFAGVNVFHSRQKDSITIDVSQPRWKYVNLGEAIFRGVELESKYYFKKDFFLLGSMMHQGNDDTQGHHNITPVANTMLKGGVSYEQKNGWTASIFENYQGPISGYQQTVNPRAEPYHGLSAYVRYDLSKHLHVNSTTGMALYAYADNLTNQELWLPDLGGNSGDTIPGLRGRSVYFGIQVWMKRD